MRARTDAAEATHQRIVNVAIDLLPEVWVDQITLDEVAARAGVTVQTVIRRFGNKESLIATAGTLLEQRIAQQRMAAPVGDVAGILQNVFDHYEDVGDMVLRALAQEGRYPALREITDRGRRLHYAWVEHTFAPFLAHRMGTEYERLRAQLIAVTDIYMWKLLRRDLLLERTQAEIALRELLGGVIGSQADEGSTYHA